MISAKGLHITSGASQTKFALLRRSNLPAAPGVKRHHVQEAERIIQAHSGAPQELSKYLPARDRDRV